MLPSIKPRYTGRTWIQGRIWISSSSTGTCCCRPSPWWDSPSNRPGRNARNECWPGPRDSKHQPHLLMILFKMNIYGRRLFFGLLVGCTIALNARAEDVVRLGNLKFAHYGAVSYMKEICPKYGVRIEERMFPKGPDIMPAIVAGEIDIAALASDGAISGRANGVPIYTVAGFAKGGARVVAGVDSGIKTLLDLKGRKVGVTRGGAQELLLLAELDKAGMTWSDKPGKDVQILYLAFSDLNQALAAKQIDAMCQSEPQSSQAINKKFGIEVMKPYTTAMG